MKKRRVLRSKSAMRRNRSPFLTPPKKLPTRRQFERAVGAVYQQFLDHLAGPEDEKPNPPRSKFHLLPALRKALGAKQIISSPPFAAADWEIAALIEDIGGEKDAQFLNHQRAWSISTGKTVTIRPDNSVIINGAVRNIRSRLGVVLPDRRMAVIAVSLEENHRGGKRFRVGWSNANALMVFSAKGYLAEAIASFQELRRIHSPFRGRLVSFDRDRVDISDPVQDVRWESIVPRPEVRDFARELLFLAREGRARSAIFVGPPGTGKTAHLTAIVNEFLGLGTAIMVRGVSDRLNLQDIYRFAAAQAPALVIFEDLDGVGVSRDENYAPFNISMLLACLDDKTADGGGAVSTLATTNFPEKVDRALIARPGRFNRIIEFPYPSRREKEALVAHYLAATGLSRPSAKNPAWDFVRSVDGVAPDHIRALVEGARDRSQWSGRDPDDCFREIARELTATVKMDKRFGTQDPMGFARDPEGVEAEFGA